jgi:hypothetical protein
MSDEENNNVFVEGDEEEQEDVRLFLNNFLLFLGWRIRNRFN